MRRSAAWKWGWLLALGAIAHAQDYSKPRVRAITAFVRLTPENSEREIDAALSLLRQVKAEFTRAGYETETLRIVTQPLAELARGQDESRALEYLRHLDERSVHDEFLPDIGPAMLHDGDDPGTMRLLEKVLTTLPELNASVSIAAEDGIHWQVIRQTAALLHDVAEHSPGSQGTFAFTATAMLKPYGPFYPGAWHAGTGRQFSIGFEGANVVQEVFARTHGDALAATSELTRQLTVHARIAESIGARVASTTGWTFMGVDPTPAPLGDRSIGAAIESYTGQRFGSSGTLTAAWIITSAVKAVPVRQVGYSGLMVPVMEDQRLAERWAQGAFNTDDLLAYSAVCGTGLDTVPYPGEISTEQLARILGDVASLAWKWGKPLSARLQPVAGARAGDKTQFKSRFLFNTTLQPLP
jgi:uncharacterized protein